MEGAERYSYRLKSQRSHGPVQDFIFNLPEEEFNSWDMDQQNNYHNLNLYDHTVSAMERLGEAIKSMADKGVPITKDVEAILQLAMLLHDTGKRHKEFQPSENGKIRYILFYVTLW